MMRQIARMMARGRLNATRPRTLAKVLESAWQPLLPRRGKKRLVDLAENQRVPLRKELASFQTAEHGSGSVHSVAHLPNVHVVHGAVGDDGWQRPQTEIWPESSFDKLKDGRDTLNNYLRKRRDSFNEKLNDALNEQKNIKLSLSKRRQHLREAYLLIRREILHNALHWSKDDVREKLILRRKVLQQALQLRKERFNDTEQKIVERSRLIMQDLRDTKNMMKEKMEEVVEKENIYTIPNLLCVTRIVFSPYLGYLIVTGSFEYALGFMVVAGVSDWLDGYIARSFKSQSTKIGSFLDPMADKILIGTLFLTLTYVDLIPVPLTALIVGRDVALVIAGFVIRYQSLLPPRTFVRYFDATHVTAQLAPTWISKINTGVQLALVGSTLAAPVFGYVGHPALTALCYVTAASTVLAAASYITSKDTYKYLSRK